MIITSNFYKLPHYYITHCNVSEWENASNETVWTIKLQNTQKSDFQINEVHKIQKLEICLL